MKLDCKIFSSWKIRKLVHGIRTHDLTHIGLKSYPLDYKSLYEGIYRVFLILSIIKLSIRFYLILFLNFFRAFSKIGRRGRAFVLHPRLVNRQNWSQIRFNVKYHLCQNFQENIIKKSGFENKFTSRFIHDTYLTCNLAVELNAGILQ